MNPDVLIHEGRNLPRVTARRFQRYLLPGLEFEDMVGAGSLGLCKAAAQFDPNRGVGFVTYALELIRYEILEMLRNWDFYSRRARLNARAEQITLPSVASLDVMIRDAIHEPIALRETIADPDPGPEAKLFAHDRSARIAQSIQSLPERELDVVRRRYAKHQTFAVIAEGLGISESRAYQLHRQAIVRLRQDVRIRALL